jgi:hypothetical protein
MTNGSDNVDSQQVDDFGLRLIDRMNAYAATSERFDLKGRQRNMLDVAETYSHIMYLAHNEVWDRVEQLLRQEGIIQ